MRLRTAICCTLLGITLISVSVISFILQSASAQSAPDLGFPGTTESPTVKSQMWIQDSTWWGIFSDGSSGLHFYKRVGSDFVKGNLVNSNVLGRPDTLWDGTNLFVLVQEDETQARLYKYSYSAGTDQYELLPGFPVTLPLTGLPVSAVIAKDSNQKLWVAYAGGESGSGGDSSIHVIWSTSDHLTWDTTGIVLETQTATNATEVAAIAAFNDGAPKIGVFFSNQRLGQYAFRYHLDTDLEASWSAKEIVDTNGLTGTSGIAGEYASITAAPDGRVLAVGNDEIGNGHVHLYVRSTAGTWAPRIVVTGATSQPSRPLILLDTENNAIYCVYRDSAFNKSIFYTRADLANPTSFVPGQIFISAKSSEPTSTKQHLNSSTDLIAASSQDGEIYWNVLDLSTAPVASFTAVPTSGDAPLAVTFVDTSVDDGPIVGHLWNFGDGFTSTEPNPIHVFRAGSWNVTLQVTDSSGNTATSASQTIVVSNVGNPVLQALTPATVNSNVVTGDFTITVDGDAFAPGAVVRFNGSDRSTSFVSTTRLIATLTLADVAASGAFPVMVVLPSSAVSNSIDLIVTGDNPGPTISSISPTTVAQGSPSFDLTVIGNNFVSGSRIWVNGTERLTTFISSTQITTNITTDLEHGLYQVPVFVVNPAPGGGTSNTVYFDITPVCPTPGPTITFQGRTEFNSVHSQLWYNDGRWSAAISDNSTGIFFWSLTNNQFVKGARIDTNRLAGVDTLWNGTELFVLTYQNQSLARFYKYSYDLVSKTYTLIPGFPVDIPLTGLASTLTFAQDSTGKLWATYTGTNNSGGDGKVHVIWTTSPDHLTWDSTGTVLETGLSVLIKEVSAITAFGGNMIGVTWSNHATNQIGFSYHIDADVENLWSVKEIISSGVGQASEYMSLKGLPDGRILLAQEDNLGDRHLKLYRRNTFGIWDAAIPVTRNPLSKPKSPIVLYDETNNEVYVLYRDSSTLYAAHMNADSNVMPAGCPVAPGSISDPTSTKQTLIGSMDLAVAGRASSNEALVIVDLPAAPPPTVFAISPDFVNAGNPDFILTIDGANFTPSSVVRINGIDRATTFVSSTQLTAQIIADDVAAGGIFPITVATLGEVDSNSIMLSVDNLAPTLDNISPVAMPAGSASFEMIATGTNFNPGTTLRFNGVDRPVLFMSSTEVRAQITAAEVTAAGVFPVECVNPSPGGGLSGPLSFTVQTSTPILTSINPTNAGAGGPAFTLTANGENFTASSVIQWNGVNLTTTFVSPTQLTAQITSTQIQNGGTFPITILNTGGSLSSAITFTVNNPAPTITTLNPSNTNAGASGFALTVNGTGFVPSSVVRINGSLPANERPTVFVSSTQLTATIDAADVASAGTFPITVFNPVPVGGLSGPVNLTVSNPVPTISGLSPNSVTAGAAGFTLTVTGTNYVNGSSVVRINGADRATTFVSATELTVQIQTAEVASAGSLSVAVFTPAPGGGLVPSVQLPVNNPQPGISNLTPSSATAGSGDLTITVDGTNFISTSVVRLNGSNRGTTFVNSTQLQAQLTAADVASAGSANITVFNPAPGGGDSTASTFTINNPLPTISGLSPIGATAGGSAFTLTVNGTGFVNGSVVRFNDIDRVTTFVSSTQVTIQITASDIATAGIAQISVFTPAPGGGISTAMDLPINNPTPTLASISPNLKAVGDAAFQLTVTGTNFNTSSIVRFNGSDRPTTFVSATQLTAQIGTADISTGGAYPIVVFSPAPGGGSSNAINLNVSNPVPAIANLSPSSMLQGSAAFTLTINGTGFGNNSVVTWNGQNRATTFVNNTQLKAQISASDLNTGGAASVVVINPLPGGGTSNASPFTVTPNPRVIKVINASGSPNSPSTLTIQLVAQGDENALGFTLVFDTSLLSNPTATVGADASSATLNVNSSQVAQGRVGIALSLPAGTSFTAGNKNLVVINFATANVTSNTQTQISFGDTPVGREVSNVTADVLPTAFIPGPLAISTGLEGDVAPRPNGSNNGTVSVADWVQVGRFASGVDPIAPGVEFQKADCAPRADLGNGAITVSDWVQAGRYASGIDPIVAAGGPSGPATGASVAAIKDSSGAGKLQAEASDRSRTVQLREILSAKADEMSVAIELNALGIENALGFSLMFDPQKFSFSSAVNGREATAGVLQVNRAGAEKGRIGIALALPTGQSFTGISEIVVLKFNRRTPSADLMSLVFTDLPVARELVSVDASNLVASFDGLPASLVNPIDDAQYFVYQHYLDILGRTPDEQGLDYWTTQITSCGSDLRCSESRRVDVSDAFFTEREFQHTGAFVHRAYKSALGRDLTYDQFVTDRSRVVGAPQELEQNKNAFTNSFVERSEFKLRYPQTMTAETFVDALNANTGNSLSEAERLRLVQGLQSGRETRGSVLRQIAENRNFIDREYNTAFVLTQYYGYLRRDPEAEGFDFWLAQMNRHPLRDIEIQRAMICAFITSPEYRMRFGPAMSEHHCGR